MKLKIIAGPCSIDNDNLDDIYEIADLQLNKKYIVWGTRVVGLKSRTNFNPYGQGMGLDFKIFTSQLEKSIKAKKPSFFYKLPSVHLAQQIIKKTNLLIATEIMEPYWQLRSYEKFIPANKLLVWNPAVSQLGWQIYTMSKFVAKNKWYLGIKNPKWIGDYLKKVNRLKYQGRTSGEKTWEGLVTYARNLSKKRIVLIHRGVDVAEKGSHRNVPVHYLAARVKRHTGCLLFFDPSHSYGPQMREAIVPATIKAMKMKFPDGKFIYDGILIEVGRSKTDAEQHLSLAEFKKLIIALSKFREFEAREI